MRIIVDMDEVIVDMMNPLLERYNKLYNSDIVIDDIAQWAIPDDMVDVYTDGDFFDALPCIDGAVAGVKWLIAHGHDVIIATNHSRDGVIAGDKVYWINRYLPELSDNLMLGARKDILQGDCIIDDNPDYLINSPCRISICMDRPWNQHIRLGRDIDYRVRSWQQILALFAGGDV